MTAEQIATYVLLFALCGAAVTGLVIAGKWIWWRSEVTEFANAITANPADVAAQQEAITDNETAAMLADILIELDDLIEYVEAVRS